MPRRRLTHNRTPIPSAQEKREIWRKQNPEAPLLDEEIRERLLPEEREVWDRRNIGYFAGSEQAHYFALRLLGARAQKEGESLADLHGNE